MKQPPRLGLHSHILPTLKRLAASEPEQHSTFYGDQLEYLQEAVVFDCRRLPSPFVHDTGKAEWHEAEATTRRIRLPFPVCYFEFELRDAYEPDAETDGEGPSGLALLAAEVDEWDADETLLGTSVVFWCYNAWEMWRDLGEEYALGPGWGRFPNGVPDRYFDVDDDEEVEGPAKFYHDVNAENPVTEAGLEIDGKYLLGVLALLNEHLVATEVRPDPEPEWNRARAKKGRLPLSCEARVLTINTAAVRRAVARSGPPSAHESPRLHWRRGHHRVLHRGSEFESRTWVRKCLVGDPTRGTIHKDYRVIWQPALLEPTPA